MPTKTIDVKTDAPQLDELLSLVREGHEVLLVDGQTPLAKLTPIEAPKPARVAGLHAGMIWTSDDFAKPLPDEFWQDADHAAAYFGAVQVAVSPQRPV